MRMGLRLAFLAFGVLAWAGRSGGEPPRPRPTPPPMLEPGDTVPPFEAEGLDGKTHRVAFPPGTHTVLLFFMSSCPSCHKLIPEWNREYEKRPAGVTVLGVLMDQEPPGFFMAMPISFPVLRAPSRTLMQEKYKVHRVPLTLRVLPGGVVDGIGQGQIDGIRLGELFRPFSGK
jgi:hypothetical protein